MQFTGIRAGLILSLLLHLHVCLNTVQRLEWLPTHPPPLLMSSFHRLHPLIFKPIQTDSNRSNRLQTDSILHPWNRYRALPFQWRQRQRRSPRRRRRPAERRRRRRRSRGPRKSCRRTRLLQIRRRRGRRRMWRPTRSTSSSTNTP